MKTKLCIWSMALLMSLAISGCKGNNGNTPDDPTQKTSDAKLISQNGMDYEVEMKGGSRLYFRKTRDYTDTPFYFSLISAGKFYVGHSQEKEMAEKYAYSGILTIPASVKIDMGGGKTETYSVEGIYDDACRGMNKLSGVQIPNSVKTIGTGAFASCDALKRVEIPNGITELRETFYSCQTLTEIKLPESLVEFQSVIDNCSSIEKVDLPQNLTIVTIAWCPSLRTIIPPQGIKRLWVCGCTSLQQIDLPNGLTDVKVSNDSALITLTIPQSIEYVGFYGCTGLKEVKCYAVEPPIYNDLLDYWVKFTLYVPKESVSKYQADESWSRYATQILPL